MSNSTRNKSNFSQPKARMTRQTKSGRVWVARHKGWAWTCQVIPTARLALMLVWLGMSETRLGQTNSIQRWRSPDWCVCVCVCVLWISVCLWATLHVGAVCSPARASEFSKWPRPVEVCNPVELCRYETRSGDTNSFWCVEVVWWHKSFCLYDHCERTVYINWSNIFFSSLLATELDRQRTVKIKSSLQLVFHYFWLRFSLPRGEVASETRALWYKVNDCKRIDWIESKYISGKNALTRLFVIMGFESK